MRALTALLITIACFAGVHAQKSNDAIQKQIKQLKAEKTIFLTYDGGSSKVMAHAPNFSDADAKSAGVEAMNFGMAYFYAGQQLASAPDTINFTFWVLTKKPRFAGTANWQATLASGPLDLGEYRYSAKAAEDMEYLNFKIKRDDLAKIAASTAPVKFKLGSRDFSFTQEQMQLLRSYLMISDPSK